MKLAFIDYPLYVPLKEYENAIDKMVLKLNKHPAILSIYQIGSVNNPGISDIDMMVIFKKGTEYKINPLKDLSISERYLFAHNLYGVTEEHFNQAQQISFFQNYKHVCGEKINFQGNHYSFDEINILKVQIALEYLIKMYINMTIERTYGIIKVRGFLLHAKALMYDFEFLGLFSGECYKLLNNIISLRNNWFEDKIDKKVINFWHNDFYIHFSELLKNILNIKHLYIPEGGNLQITKNVTIESSGQLEYTHKGINLPKLFSKLGKRYFNIQHRFNKFNFKFPIVMNDIPKILLKRYKLINELNEYNKQRIPHFAPVAYGLPIF